MLLNFPLVLFPFPQKIYLKEEGGKLVEISTDGSRSGGNPGKPAAASGSKLPAKQPKSSMVATTALATASLSASALKSLVIANIVPGGKPATILAQALGLSPLAASPRGGKTKAGSSGKRGRDAKPSSTEKGSPALCKGIVHTLYRTAFFCTGQKVERSFFITLGLIDVLLDICDWMSKLIGLVTHDPIVMAFLTVWVSSPCYSFLDPYENLCYFFGAMVTCTCESSVTSLKLHGQIAMMVASILCFIFF